ncbi:MAG: DUF1572 family protein [Gemmatirosa sp.]
MSDPVVPPSPAAVPTDPALAALAHCRLRLTRAFPRQIHAAVEALDDAQLWWQPNAHSNSVGAVVRHLAGNIRALVGHGIGSSGYVRDRDAEFAAPPIARAALLAEFDAAIAEADAVLAALTSSRLAAPSSDPTFYPTVLEDVLNVTIHMSTHVGQVVWIAKMLRDGALDDVWRRTHREVGAYGRVLGEQR